MTPIALFYHAYLVNDWRALATEQLAALIRSGLYQAAESLNVGVVSSGESCDELRHLMADVLTSHRLPSKVNYRHTTTNCGEYVTIRWLKEHLDACACYALYHHMKGITVRPDDAHHLARVQWRLCMQYFCVERWADMVSRLAEGYDTAGISWRQLYVGNFFWITSDYARRLEDVKSMPARRYYYEKWIRRTRDGSTPKFYDAHYTDDFLNDALHPPALYRLP